MKCTTVRSGVECFFMKASGCSYAGGTCYAIIEECEGCDRVKNFEGGKYCHSSPEPSIRWRYGTCNLATHIKAEVTETKSRAVNPLKASKRKMSGS